MQKIVVAALYKFADLDNYQDMQKPLRDVCNYHHVKGTLLLAEEGINGTIAGTREGIDAVLSHIRSDKRLTDLEYKESRASSMPFYRMKVRLKKEIVTLGVDGVDPNKQVGTYVSPEEWNQLIEDPEVVVVDTRNSYEVEIGTFKRAIDPKTESFREFPEFVEKDLLTHKGKKIAMFCTGGIRCEKASSYLLRQGFEHVYHLKGGILKYLEVVEPEKTLWEGECFVFDHRVAVTQDVAEGSYDVCFGCRYPLSLEDKKSPAYEAGVSCPHCISKQSEKSLKRAKERHKQVVLAQKRNQAHIGRRV